MKKTTSLQVKKRRIRRGAMVAACAMCLVMGLGGKAYAGSLPYGDIWLNYDGSVSASWGTSTTSGAPDPYLNYASVVIYGDDDTKSQGTTYTTGAGSTTALRKGTNLKKAVTYHAATYTNGAFLEDFRKQIIYTVTR